MMGAKLRLGRQLAIAAGAVSALAAASVSNADTYGRQERVRMMTTPAIEVVAQLDGSVDHSSLHALDVKYFINSDGGTSARFIIDNGSVLPGNRVQVERPVIRDARTAQNGGGIEHNPVVELDICVGNRVLKTQLNLSDRKTFTAPLVIGRSELAKLGSVDASRQFTHNATCSVEAGKGS